jgi:hypothetical protein
MSDKKRINNVVRSQDGYQPKPSKHTNDIITKGYQPSKTNVQKPINPPPKKP